MRKLNQMTKVKFLEELLYEIEEACSLEEAIVIIREKLEAAESEMEVPEDFSQPLLDEEEDF